MKSRVIISAVVFFFVLSFSYAYAEVPKMINYQGKITTPQGALISDTFSMVFSIYADSTGGTPLWTETQPSVKVEYGVFSVLLGSVNPIPASVFDGNTRYLGLKVGNDNEMIPRKAIVSVGYAYHSGTADTAHFAMPDADWTIVGDTIYHLNGNVGIGTRTPEASLHLEGDGLRLSYQSLAPAKIYVGSDMAYANNFCLAHEGSSGSGRAIRFMDWADGGWKKDVMTLNIDNGNVGIGTTSPEQRLSVLGLIRSRGHGSDPYYADFASAYNYQESFFINVRGGDPNETRILSFGGGDTWLNSYGTDRAMVIKGFNGNVGIGTTSPAYKLDVAGNGRFSGVLRVANASDPDPKNPALSADAGSSGSGIAGRCAIAGEYFGVWGYNSNGIGMACGTGDPSGTVPALRANSYSSNRDYLAIWALGRIEATGSVKGNSSTDGVNAVEGYNSGTYAGVAGVNNKPTGGGPGVYGESVSGYAGYFKGNVYVTGTINKGALGFKIDHPADPANKYLYHSGVESSDMMNIYNGNVVLNANGEAWVELPQWFEALNKDFRYQLTAIGQPGPDLYIAQEISGNRFKIAGGKGAIKVSWQVTGIRKDAYAEKHRIIVEEEKPPQEKGKYLHPKELGMPEAMEIGYAESRKGE